MTLCILCGAEKIAGHESLTKHFFHTFVNVDEEIRHLPFDAIHLIKVIASMDTSDERVRHLFVTYVLHIHATLDVGESHMKRVKKLWESSVPPNDLGCVSPEKCGHTLEESRRMMMTGEPFTVAMNAIPISEDPKSHLNVLLPFLLKFIHKAQFQ